MRSRQAQEAAKRNAEVAVARARGELPPIIGFVGFRAAVKNIPDINKLPVETDTDGPLQTEEGNFVAQFGFSAFGGGDVHG